MPYFSSADKYDLTTAKPSVFEPDYSWYEGMTDAVMNVPLNMARRLGQGAYLMGGGLLSYSSQMFDGEIAEWLERESDRSFEVVDSLQNQLNDSYAEAAGWGSQIVQNVGEMVGGVALAGGVGYGSIYGATEAAKEVAEGKDLLTAYSLGAVRGGTIAVGALTPAAVGTSTAARVSSGAGINLGTGIIARGAEKQILERGGYKKEADALTVFDGYSMLADVIMGAGFGYLTRGQQDAAEAVSKLKNVDDQAPKPLETGEDVKIHRDNMRESVLAELEGRDATIKSKMGVEPAPLKTDVQRYAELEGTEGGRKPDAGAKAPASGVPGKVGQSDTGGTQEGYSINQPPTKTLSQPQIDQSIIMADGRTYAQNKADADALIAREQTIAQRAQSILGCLLTGA